MPYISVVPLQVTDLDAAKRFYIRTLGFNLVMDERMEGGRRWVELRPVGGLTAIVLVLAGEEGASGAATTLHLNVDTLEPTISTWAERGVNFAGEIVEHTWARFIPFTDPDGNKWILSELPKPWNLAELPSPATS
jgi:catechol 2,3-dioxygenase-like lactoylglutathione lyase family enzyme